MNWFSNWTENCRGEMVGDDPLNDPMLGDEGPQLVTKESCAHVWVAKMPQYCVNCHTLFRERNGS